MNDFTKEELEIIYQDMTIHAKKATPLCEPQSHLNLRNKIMILINNYCNHEECKHEFRSEPDELPLAQTVCCGQELEYTNTTWSTPKCHKCGEFYR
jgi:hypothetical protein